MPGDADDRQMIAQYRVIRRLGAGGMGEVYLVQHPRLPRQDALKLLDLGVSRNDEFKARFVREADLLSGLSHPNIVTVYDRGEYLGRLWLAMEYVPGSDAAHLLRDHGPLALVLAADIIRGAADALLCLAQTPDYSPGREAREHTGRARKPRTRRSSQAGRLRHCQGDRQIHDAHLSQNHDRDHGLHSPRTARRPRAR